MENSKLINLLNSLSPWECISFRKYVASPYFNVNDKVSMLLDSLLNQVHTDEALDIRSVYRSVYGNIRFDHQQLRYVMTDLTRLLEDFISLRKYEDDSMWKKRFLLRQLKERRHNKYFTQHLSSVKKDQADVQRTDLGFYRHGFAIEEIHYEYSREAGGRSDESNLQQISDSLDVNYICHKLKYCCEMLNRQNVLQEKFDLGVLTFINDFIHERYQHIPLIAVYYKIYILFSDLKDEKHYKELKVLIEKYHASIAINELRDIYVFVQNYCIRMINSGNNAYLQELFDTYVAMINNETIFENGEMGHLHFKNIVTLALRLDETDWAESFVNKHASDLNIDLRKNALNYNAARIFYARRKYREALRIMRNTTFEDIYYHLDARVLLLKIYYEMEEVEPLFSLISTMRIYLKRSKQISDYQRTIYINMLNYIRRLARIKAGEKGDAAAINIALDADKDVADINWLKAKASEMH